MGLTHQLRYELLQSKIWASQLWLPVGCPLITGPDTLLASFYLRSEGNYHVTSNPARHLTVCVGLHVLYASFPLCIVCPHVYWVYWLKSMRQCVLLKSVMSFWERLCRSMQYHLPIGCEIGQSGRGSHLSHPAISGKRHPLPKSPGIGHCPVANRRLPKSKSL